jgi:hypothetical protein
MKRSQLKALLLAEGAVCALLALALRLIKAVAGYDPEKGRLEQHIFAQLKYELLSCRSAYRLCGMTGTPLSFRKSHIISIDALSEDSSLYEEALAA